MLVALVLTRKELLYILRCYIFLYKSNFNYRVKIFLAKTKYLCENVERILKKDINSIKSNSKTN